jgi:hypothetical protein
MSDTPVRSGAFARRGALAVWLLCLLAAIGITWRTTYVADLSAFLPSTPSAEQAVLLDQLRTGVAARLVLIGIEGGTQEARSKASLQLAQALRKSGAFEAVHNGDNSQFAATGKFLFEHRYLLSPAVDAQRFTAELSRMASARGVTFAWDTEIQAVVATGDAVEGVRTVREGPFEMLIADAYVMALGSYSPFLLAPIRVPCNVYPAKGYSATIDIGDHRGAPTGELVALSLASNRALLAEVRAQKREIEQLRRQVVRLAAARGR